MMGVNDDAGRALFSDRARTDSSPARHDERLYPFLDRVAGPWFDAVRGLLQDWLDATPDVLAARLAREFRTPRNRQLYGAFWELYQFTLWSKLGFEVVPEPAIPGSTRSGDLLVRRDGGTALVEATVSFDEEADSAASRRLGAAYEALERLDSPNFFLWIDVEQGEGPMPSLAPVRRDLEAWLTDLDPDEVAVRDGLPSREVAAGSWCLRFQAIPKSQDARGQPGIRPLGVFGTGGARMIDTVGRLRRALVAKADQVRGADAPVVIAVDALGIFVDEDDIFSMLFGTEAVQFLMRDDELVETRSIRQPTGLWTEGRRGRRSHVSAVLTTENAGPWNVSRVEPVLWLNPWAERPLKIDLPFRTIGIDLGAEARTERAASRRIAEVFGLPDQWPGAGNAWET